LKIAPLNTIITFNDVKKVRHLSDIHNIERYEKPKSQSSTLNLGKSYMEHLSNAKPTKIGSGRPGSLSAIGGHTIISMTIAPLNTEVSFSNFKSWNPYSAGLSAISDIQIPENFNWKDDEKKGLLIAKPGNQMLCGSCWAISTAGIIADNFVVTGLVDYIPDLSTTWILVNFPQLQCGGGNPALAFQQIAQASESENGGVATNRCIDYSWCATNKYCNGDAKKHLDNNALSTEELNNLIPKNPGCYDANVDHLLFKIQDVSTLAIGMTNSKTNTEITDDDWKTILPQIKKHIFIQGPVLGGFLVFKNFMDGLWCKTTENKGIYLENGIYGKGISFDDSQTDASNYKGSHAVAIIGWGIGKDVIIDNKGTKADVPYWFCRNSWTEKWGSDGYFKIAMYPYNKLAQFDKQVTISSSGGKKNTAGGIVLIKTTKKPEAVKLDAVTLNPDATLHTSQDKSYYSKESNENKPSPPSPPSPSSPSSPESTKPPEETPDSKNNKSKSKSKSKSSNTTTKNSTSENIVIVFYSITFVLILLTSYYLYSKDKQIVPALLLAFMVLLSTIILLFTHFLN
jgi:hypothetical protein